MAVVLRERPQRGEEEGVKHRVRAGVTIVIDEIVEAEMYESARSMVMSDVFDRVGREVARLASGIDGVDAAVFVDAAWSSTSYDGGSVQVSPAARSGDPETSHEAAASVWNPSEVQAKVLEILWADWLTDFAGGPGMTDEEIAVEYERRFYPAPTPQSIRSRRAELVRRGLVVFAGSYRKTATGRRARRWRITRDGRRLYTDRLSK